MNKKMLQKMRGTKVRIRPVPYKRTLNGLKETDVLWFVENVTKDFIEISNLSTDHIKKIPLDHFQEYKTDARYGSDGFLILRSQLIMDGYAVNIEPIIKKG